MILDSMMSDKQEERRQGEKILENYKKQLADRMAREKIQLQALGTSNSLGGKSGRKKSNKEAEEFRMKRLQSYNSNEVPDPEIL